jgi:hypothetical protein
LLARSALAFMNIRFTSSLTPEDENVLAPALLQAMSSILDLLPIAYVIRIDTCDAHVYQHSGSGGRLELPAEVTPGSAAPPSIEE